MRTRSRRPVTLVVVAALTLGLAACSNLVDGSPSVANAPDAKLDVRGGSSSSTVDRLAQNTISDVEQFWRTEYPKISGGKTLPALKGGLYSIDGAEVVRTKSVDGQPVKANACAQRSIRSTVDNAFFCRLDDSIAWDRTDTHLVGALTKKYGDLVAALIFAHEFGHAIQYRLGVFDKDLPTIDTESQADCAAGAWAKAATQGRAPHYRDIDVTDVDNALEGFLNGRDSTPETEDDVSHGNGFDRLSAVADGFSKGASFCFGNDYFDSRVFTERPYSSAADQESGGNLPYAQVVTTTDNALIDDLNRFWTSAAPLVHKTFKPVKIAEAAHPKCGAADDASEFAYCPDDNTIYFSTSVAQRAYNSLPDIQIDPTTADVRLLFNQPADFALGTLYSMGFGFAVRHQLFGKELSSSKALQAAVCYSGAYAKDVNVPAQAGKPFTLSPADLDESVAALLDEVPQDVVFGARDTTGLSRVQQFIKGYQGGLSTC